jgi:hypothetical protein
MIDAVVNWYTEAPVERSILIFAVADIIVQKTPWKGDDDLLKMVKDIFAAVLGGKKK